MGPSQRRLDTADSPNLNTSRCHRTTLKGAESMAVSGLSFRTVHLINGEWQIYLVDNSCAQQVNATKLEVSSTCKYLTLCVLRDENQDNLTDVDTGSDVSCKRSNV